jgi:hypothetical protein
MGRLISEPPSRGQGSELNVEAAVPSAISDSFILLIFIVVGHVYIIL